jgi:hypothetical protein
MSVQKKSSNNIFILIGISVGAIASIVILFSFMFASPTLDQILEKRDCAALEKWGQDKIYRNDLNLTPKQQSGITNLGIECGMKIVKNIFPSLFQNTNSEKPNHDVKDIIPLSIDKYKYHSGEIVKVVLQLDDPSIQEVMVSLERWDASENQSQKEIVIIDKSGNGYVDFVIPERYGGGPKGMSFSVDMFVQDNPKPDHSVELRVLPKLIPKDIFDELNDTYSELNDKKSQLAVSKTLVPWITDTTVNGEYYKINATVKVTVWLSHQVSEDIQVNMMNVDKEIIQEISFTTKDFGIGSVDIIMPRIESCHKYLLNCPLYLESYLKNHPDSERVTDSIKYIIPDDVKKIWESEEKYNKRMEKSENNTVSNHDEWVERMKEQISK